MGPGYQLSPKPAAAGLEEEELCWFHSVVLGRGSSRASVCPPETGQRGPVSEYAWAWPGWCIRSGQPEALLHRAGRAQVHSTGEQHASQGKAVCGKLGPASSLEQACRWRQKVAAVQREGRFNVGQEVGTQQGSSKCTACKNLLLGRCFPAKCGERKTEPSLWAPLTCAGRDTGVAGGQEYEGAPA